MPLLLAGSGASRAQRLHVLREPITGGGDGVLEQSEAESVELGVELVVLDDQRSLFVGKLVDRRATAR